MISEGLDYTKTNERNFPLETKMTMAEHFKHKLLIVKADDFGRGPLMDPWRRFVDLCLNHATVPSIGIVGQGLSKNSTIGKTARHFSENLGVEFWNHSYAHHDITKMTSEETKKDTTKCQVVIENSLGKRPRYYGAPFNAVHESSVAAIMSLSEFHGIYFADDLVEETKTISKSHLITPELSTQALFPVSKKHFDTKFASKKDKNCLVMQVHPTYWSDQCFEEFETTLKWCIDQGYQPINFEEYIVYRSLKDGEKCETINCGALLKIAEELYDVSGLEENRSIMPEAAERSYYFGRFKGPLVRTARFLEAHGLTRGVGSNPAARILDVGAGVGNWAASCVAVQSNATAIALDRNKPLVDFMSKNLGRLTKDSRLSFMSGDAGRLPFEKGDFDHVICNNALNYMELDYVLPEFSRSLKYDGLLLAGVQNDLYPLIDAIRFLIAKDREGALNRIDRIFANQLRREGIRGRRHFVNYWNDEELITTARYSGLHPLLRGIRLPEEYGRVLGLPVLWGYLFIRTEASEKNALNLASGKNVGPDDALILSSAGASRALVRLLKAQSPADRTPLTLLRALKILSDDRSETVRDCSKKLSANGIDVSQEIINLAVIESDFIASSKWADLLSLRNSYAVSASSEITIRWMEARSQNVPAHRSIVSGGLLDVAFDLGQLAMREDWQHTEEIVEGAYDLLGQTGKMAAVLSGNLDLSIVASPTLLELGTALQNQHSPKRQI